MSIFTHSPKDFILPRAVSLDEAPPIVFGKEQVIYSNSASLKDADLHAMSVNCTKYIDFRELMWHLIYKKHFSQLQRCRIIFKWLLTAELSNVTFEKIYQDSPEATFIDINPHSNGRHSSFSKAFQLLCLYSQIYCSNVYGFAKGGKDYKPGKKLNVSDQNHTWNAVCIDYRWYLVDLHWAQCYLENYAQESKVPQMIYQLDDFYFFMDPYRSIYMHFPVESKWQLVPHPMTLEQFENLPYIKSQFFNTGMQFVGNESGVKITNTGRLRIEHTYCAVCEFSFTLHFIEDGVLKTEIENRSVNSFGILEVERSKVVLYLRIPFAGQYLATIYSKIVKNIKDLSDVRFLATVKYAIDVVKPSAMSYPIIGFLKNGFGPSWPLMQHYQINPINFDSGIISLEGELPINTEIIFALDWPFIKLLSKIRAPNLSTSEQNPMKIPYNDELIAEEIREPKDYSITIRLPEYGEYVYELYASNPNEEKDFVLVCQYLIDCKRNKSFLISNYPEQENKVSLDALPDPYTIAVPNPLLEFEGKPLKHCSQGGSSIQGITSDNSKKNINSPSELYSEKSCLSSDEKIRFTGEMKESLRPFLPENFERIKPCDSARLEYGRVLDEETIMIGIKDGKTVDQLLWELIYSRELTQDQDKIRAIFIWLCTKNLDDMDITDAEPDSAENLIMNVKHGKFSYADAFALMCRFIGIRCVVVEGFSKGKNFRPGVCVSMANRRELLHTWNAAMINGVWRLFDCQWAARRDTRSDRFDYSLDDFYFGTNPDLFKFSHYPHDEKWQLSSESLTFEDFLISPNLKSKFFQKNLALLSHLHGFFKVTTPIFTVSIGYNLNNGPIIFCGMLKKEISDSNQLHDEDSRVCWEDDIKDGSTVNVTFEVRLPSTGIFVLILMCKMPEDTRFETFVEYRVQGSDFAPSNCLPEYPHRQSIDFYGPSYIARQLQLQCSLGKMNRVHDVYNEITIQFWPKIPISLIMMAIIRCSPKKKLSLNNNYKQSVSFDFFGNPNTRFTFYFPADGEYALEIYGARHAGKNTEICMLWQIMVDVKLEPCWSPPRLPCAGLQLGPTLEFEKLGFETLSHPDPEIFVDSIDASSELDLKVVLKSPKAGSIQAIAELYKLITPTREEKLPNNAFLQFGPEDVSVLMRFPSAGIYILRIYATQTTGSKLKYAPSIYNYCITCDELKDGATYFGQREGGFPLVSTLWRDAYCSLNAPYNGVLYKNNKCDSLVEFSVKLLRADDVAIVTSDYVSHFSKIGSDQEYDLWNSIIQLPDENNSKIFLCARWSDDTFNYDTLLEYEVRVR